MDGTIYLHPRIAFVSENVKYIWIFHHFSINQIAHVIELVPGVYHDFQYIASRDHQQPLASYQIRKISGCACAGNAGNVFPATDIKVNRELTIPACITARASSTCRDACRDRWPKVAGKTFPAFPAHAQPAILRIWQISVFWGPFSIKCYH